jgi:acyl carrier protein
MYRELFTYYLANEGNENLIDGTLLGFGVGDILSFQAVELMDLVEEMYAKEMVDENICGDIETVKKEIVAKRRRYRRIEWDIFETYADIRGERKKKPEEELTQEERKEIMRGFDSDIQELIEDYWEEGEDFEEIYEEDELPPIFAKSPEPRLPLVQGFSKFSRNDKVSVRYKDGTVKKDVKFKKVEEDLKNGKCEII